MKRRAWLDPGDPEAVVELTDIIDEGASGAVFEGMFKGERVAVKVIPGLQDAEIEKEVQEEISILRKTSSAPYLVGFRGAWEKEDHAWIAMEICDGGSAIDLCQICQTTLKTEECAALCASVLMALKFLHETLGVVHRDIKGKNILFTRDGKVKLTDLGIAVVSPEKDPKNKPLPAGSPHWMAPELSSKAQTCFVNDIWSLGITLIELVEGEPPYSDIAPTEVLKVIESSAAPSFSEATKKHVGADLVSFLAACLTKDPSKRPNAAKLLKHPLVDGFVMHLMVSEKPEPVIEQLIERALPIISEYREFERLRRAEIVEEQIKNSPAGKPAPQKWSEADSDVFVVDEAKDDPKPPAKAVAAPAPVAKKKWSEADGDLVVVEAEPNKGSAQPKVRFASDVASPTKHPGPKQTWSEADGDLVVTNDRQSMRMEFIEGERDKSTYQSNVARLNANRERKRPESIRKTEKIVQVRQSARRQSEIVRDSDQVRSMQARLAQLQSKFDRDVSKMKKMLPKGFGLT
jgi:serine/threonine protein kinase